LALPNQASYNTTGVPYDIDDHLLIGPFTRVGYYLEFDPIGASTQWVWASMDPFTSNVTQIGVPTINQGGFFQQYLTRMNVTSSVSNVVTGTSLPGGNMEFWWGNYGKANGVGVPGASDTLYDWGDSASLSDPAGSGSMQIHNWAASQTIFAFNNWGQGNGPIDLGIGNNPAVGGNPDWTSAGNGGQYSFKVLQVYAAVDSNGNGLPDAWETAYFGNLDQTANSDFDSDGLTNYEEFLAGTNPTVPQLSVKICAPGGATNVP
jgi:sialate O-acetylesterase